MTTLATTSIISPSELTRPKPKGRLNPKKCSWRDNYANSQLSGIEYRDAQTDELVHFTAIQHKEVIKEPGPAFRVTLTVDKDRNLSLPRKQTFEEMIQAKRKQQNLLYASNHSNNSSTALSSRAARRVSEAARRRSAAAAAAAATTTTPITSRPSSQRIRNEVVSPLRSSGSRPNGTSTSNSSSKRSRSSSQRKRPSRPTSSRRPTADTAAPTVASIQLSPTSKRESAPASTAITAATSITPIKQEPDALYAPSTSTTGATHLRVAGTISLPPNAGASPIIKPSMINSTFSVKPPGSLVEDNNRSLQMISSMKELARQNPSLGSMDKKEIKRLLKSAPPGAALVLSNGTVIKKSRRGGARAGAGRKRNRPSGGGSNSPSKGSLQGQQSDTSSRSITTPNSKSNQSTQIVDSNNSVLEDSSKVAANS